MRAMRWDRFARSGRAGTCGTGGTSPRTCVGSERSLRAGGFIPPAADVGCAAYLKRGGFHVEGCRGDKPLGSYSHSVFCIRYPVFPPPVSCLLSHSPPHKQRGLHGEDPAAHGGNGKAVGYSAITRRGSRGPGRGSCRPSRNRSIPGSPATCCGRSRSRSARRAGLCGGR